MRLAEGKQADWDEGLKKNDDDYGQAIYRYAKRWMELMEAKLDAGAELTKEFVDSTSHAADTEGITGFMNGAAASMIAAWWFRGEEFRLAYNRSVQIQDEGEKANVSGSILNPAMLTMEVG